MNSTLTHSSYNFSSGIIYNLNGTSVDKKGNRRRTRSAFHDAANQRELKELWRSKGEAQPANPAGTSVIGETQKSEPTTIGDSEEEQAKGKPMRKRSNFPTFDARHTSQPLRKYLRVQPWRDTCDELRPIYYHRAMENLGPVQAFSLNLRPDIEAKARKEDSPASWLRKRIAERLKEAFGRPINVWFVIEETDDRERRLHIHGEIGLTFDEAPRMRAALRKAGGVWLNCRQHQSHSKDAPDEGWANYCAKNMAKATKTRRSWVSNNGYVASFNGAAAAASNTVRTEAERLYEKDRRDLNAERAKAKAQAPKKRQATSINPSPAPASTVIPQSPVSVAIPPAAPKVTPAPVSASPSITTPAPILTPAQSRAAAIAAAGAAMRATIARRRQEERELNELLTFE